MNSYFNFLLPYIDLIKVLPIGWKSPKPVLHVQSSSATFTAKPNRTSSFYGKFNLRIFKKKILKDTEVDLIPISESNQGVWGQALHNSLEFLPDQFLIFVDHKAYQLCSNIFSNIIARVIYKINHRN